MKEISHSIMVSVRAYFAEICELKSHITAIHEGKKPSICNIYKATFAENHELSTNFFAVHK